jgi:hypothetical protein
MASSPSRENLIDEFLRYQFLHCCEELGEL